jgi:hypothetical protein
LGPVTAAGLAMAMAVLAGCAGGAAHHAPAALARTTPDPAPASVTTTTTAPAGGGLTTTSTSAAPPGPARPAPVVAAGWNAVAGDGTWRAASWLADGTPVLYTTVLHPGPTAAPVALTWLDPAHTRVALYAGTAQPGGRWTYTARVAPALVSTLVATFNSGFELNASRGGWYADGRAAVSLRAGAASLVIRSDGTATVGMWGRDASMGPGVVAVRQNLELIVDGGAPAPDLAGRDFLPRWGYTVGGGMAVWRSAVGVDATGHLIYLAGPALTPTAVANLLVAAGAVRAMELDINPMWVSWDTFAASLVGRSATKLLPAMTFNSTHFLVPDTRDFFAVFVR